MVIKPYERWIGLLAIATPIWAILLYVIMASLRPEFSHATKAISELGSIDAPNLWVWNIAGYFLPGLAISLLGYGIASHFRGKHNTRLAAFSLVGCGLLMCVSGVFPGDFEDRTSPTMIMHAVGAFGSFLAFLVTGLTLPRLLLRFQTWRAYAWPSVGLVLMSFCSGFLRFGNAPGIGQRLGFLFFFAWIALIGYGLYRNSGRELLPV